MQNQTKVRTPAATEAVLTDFEPVQQLFLAARAVCSRNPNASGLQSLRDAVHDLEDLLVKRATPEMQKAVENIADYCRFLDAEDLPKTMVDDGALFRTDGMGNLWLPVWCRVDDPADFEEELDDRDHGDFREDEELEDEEEEDIDDREDVKDFDNLYEDEEDEEYLQPQRVSDEEE